MTTTIAYGFAAPALVHFDQLDPMGMLHNSQYAILVERALAAWWAERGVSFENGRPTTPDAFTAVRDFAITYRRPVRGTGEILVHFWVERLGETSIDYRFRVTSADGETLHADGRRLSVHLHPITLRPVPWTDQGREVAAALVKPEPAHPDRLTHPAW
ncbi:acyl-CoA thioesterase [Actinoplanes sp. NPDC049265]|uniref:acyl-CoA thioesterase n=1 Tax=Actinoplanes sp. NPDC049265 TaxID=3363902 RepID=UPI003722D1BC